MLGSALTAKEEVLVLNRPARRYTGTVEDQEFDILWLEQEHLPARVHRKSKGYEEIMELKETIKVAVMVEVVVLVVMVARVQVRVRAPPHHTQFA